MSRSCSYKDAMNPGTAAAWGVDAELTGSELEVGDRSASCHPTMSHAADAAAEPQSCTMAAGVLAAKGVHVAGSRVLHLIDLKRDLAIARDEDATEGAGSESMSDLQTLMRLHLFGKPQDVGRSRHPPTTLLLP